jgi:hypothetical protein
MNDTDLIILVIFLIFVTYVVFSAIESLDKQTKVEFQKAELTDQLSTLTLEETSLKDIVDINFGFKPQDRFPFEKQPASILAFITNKSKNIQIYVDWDKSTITNYATTARRVIHLTTADRLVNSAQQPLLIQAPNPISPGTSLTAQLAPEDSVKHNVESNILEAKVPIIDFKDLERRSTDTKDRKAPIALKQKRIKFFTRRAPIEFSLRLMLRMNSIDNGGGRTYEYPVLCKFKLLNMPWWDQLPWNPIK